MSGPFVLAAGGTGGHLFPAQALAAELGRRGHRLVLITDRRGAGYQDRFPDVDLHAVAAGTPSGRGPLGRIAALGAIARGTLSARHLLKRLRPAAVVGFGGYPSLPAMLAARQLGLPSLLHEQNAVLGRVNRLLAPRVGRIAVSFAKTHGIRPADRPKAVLTGNPVRQAVAMVREQPYAPPRAMAPLNLLVLGGSQGARVLSEVLPHALAGLPEEMKSRLRITQQCRPEDLQQAAATYREAGIAADLATFIEDVPARLASAQLCISRSGASSVAELTTAGRPAVLVPYAHATDDHQTANALALSGAGAAVLLPQERFQAAALGDLLAGLLDDGDRLAAMAAAAYDLGRPLAAAALADLVETMAPANGGRGQGRAAA